MKANGNVTLSHLRESEIVAAAQLLSRAMRDNPLHIRTFGMADLERRRRSLEWFFRPALFGLSQRGLIFAAYLDGELVGVCGVARPGCCQPKIFEKLSVLRGLALGSPLRASLRALKWTAAWKHRDPASSHWHLGPIAVEPRVQHQGLGSALLSAACKHVDAHEVPAYLETDREANVAFYRRFGFEVIDGADVLGIPNWFMSRARASSRP